MLYDVIVNGKLVATVGPTELEHVSVSVSTSSHVGGIPFLMASGMSPQTEDGRQTYTTWLENELSENDRIEIIPSKNTQPSDALKTRKLRRGVSSSNEDKFCDFCKQDEAVVGPVIQAGEAPYICKSCAELCIEIFRGLENEA
ncbi:MAG: ClpX C4-type zinc finger protein [Gammaproteobacteria bacterium]